MNCPYTFILQQAKILSKDMGDTGIYDLRCSIPSIETNEMKGFDAGAVGKPFLFSMH